MRIEQGLQSNHSDYMRLVATLTDEPAAQQVHSDFVRHLNELLDRADRFTCSGFGRSFKTMKEFEAWKKKEWDPVADDRCTLKVTRRRGSIRASGDYGLILVDWSREDTAVARDGLLIIVRAYTAGYGFDHLEEWFRKHGASVQTYVEGEEHAFRNPEDALAEVEASDRTRRPRGL